MIRAQLSFKINNQMGSSELEPNSKSGYPQIHKKHEICGAN